MRRDGSWSGWSRTCCRTTPRRSSTRTTTGARSPPRSSPAAPTPGASSLTPSPRPARSRRAASPQAPRSWWTSWARLASSRWRRVCSTCWSSRRAPAPAPSTATSSTSRSRGPSRRSATPTPCVGSSFAAPASRARTSRPRSNAPPARACASCRRSGRARRRSQMPAWRRSRPCRMRWARRISSPSRAPPASRRSERGSISPWTRRPRQPGSTARSSTSGRRRPAASDRKAPRRWRSAGTRFGWRCALQRRWRGRGQAPTAPRCVPGRPGSPRPSPRQRRSSPAARASCGTRWPRSGSGWSGCSGSDRSGRASAGGSATPAAIRF